MRTWQRLVIALLRRALEAGRLKSGMVRAELECLLTREETRHWRVHLQAFDGKEHFLRYAGRYVRRPPIAQRRILSVANGFVRFGTRISASVGRRPCSARSKSSSIVGRSTFRTAIATR